MNIADYVGKRCLLKVERRMYGSDSTDEYKILEVSPSGHWVKLQNINGNKFWRAVGDVAFVEELKTFVQGE